MPPPEKPQSESTKSHPELKPWQQGYRFDTNGQDGAILLGDGQPTVEETGKILQAQVPAENHLPKTTIDESTPSAAQAAPLPDGLIDPALRAFSARFAYLAVTNNLTADNGAVTSALKKTGPMGEQLLARLSDMEEAGWKLKPMGFNDRYLQLEKPGIIGRMGKMVNLSGYHYDYFKGEQLRTVAYNNFNNMLGGVLGTSYNTGSPVKHIAAITAHELAHQDKTLADFKDMSKLSHAEQQTLARRLLATETRAILTQLHVADKVGDLHLSNDSLKAALVKRDLGGFIHDAWGKSSSTYSSFGSIDRQYAKTFVNEFIDDLSKKTAASFNSPLIDPKTGRVGVFDLNEGVGKRFGSIAGDDDLLKRMNSPTLEAAAQPGRFSTFMESRTGRVLGHGMRGLAAVGLVATVADLKGAYEESFEKGNARLARVGVDWAGFEVGMALGARLSKAIAISSKVKVPVAAIPLAAMAVGFGGSYVADKHIGEKLERYVAKNPTEL